MLAEVADDVSSLLYFLTLNPIVCGNQMSHSQRTNRLLFLANESAYIELPNVRTCHTNGDSETKILDGKTSVVYTFYRSGNLQHALQSSLLLQ